MSVPVQRTLVVRVDERVHANLGRMAAAKNMSAERYAQLLFDAAYAARCGFGQGDAALEVAVAQIDRGAIAAPVAAPAEDAGELRRARAEIAQLQDDVARLTRERNASESVWSSRLAAVPDVAKVKAESAELRREISRLSHELETAARPVVDLEAVRDTLQGGLAEIGKLFTAEIERISEHLGAASREMSDAVVRMEASIEATRAAAPASQPSAPQKAKTEFIWGGRWAR